MTEHRAGMMRNSVGRVIAASLVMVFTVSALAGPVEAQDAPAENGQAQFGITPAHPSPDDPTSRSYFTYHLKPGDRLTDEALVLNDGDGPIQLQIYRADATTAGNGGLAFGLRSDKITGTASWISLDRDEVSLGPHETALVPFTIAVPTDASPGDHLAGLLVQLAPTDNKPGSNAPQFSVDVVQRVGIAVAIDIPGARVTQLEVTNLRLGQQNDQGDTFELTVANTGNVMAKGPGTLTITDLPGNELAQIPFNVATVLPETSTAINISYPVFLEDGNYLLDASMKACAVADEEDCHTSVLEDVQIEVVDGQPGQRNGLDPADKEVAVRHLAGQQESPTNHHIGLYVSLAAIALVLLAAGVITRRRIRSAR